jgi:predicted phage terminase large subunit-like protein
MPRATSPFYVPQDAAETILEDIALRVGTKAKLHTKSFNADLGETPEEAEAALATMRTDINRYGEYVFGHAPAKVHRYWNQQVDDVITRRIPQNKILILAPPNSAKSTWNSLVRPCHYLGQHPDHNLLFMTSSDPMAQTFGGAIRMTLQESERHREVFPDPQTRPNRYRGWSSDGLYLRGTPVGTKDPAYKAVGYGMSVMGARAHGIILDDVLDQKEAESEIEQQKAIDYFIKTVVPRLNTQGGWLLAVMTRFAEGDLGGRLIKLAEESGDWIILRTPLEAEDDDPMGRRPGESLWPEQFPPEFIAATKKSMTIAQYDLVYQADPTGSSGDIFTSENYFKDLPEGFWQEIFPRCFSAQAVDLNFSKNKRTCYTVILTYAVDALFNMYILHIERARYAVKDSEERLKEIIRWTHPLVTVIETENFHDAAIRSMVIRIMSEIMCDIRLDKPMTDKIARSRLPAGRAEHGFMYVDRSAPWYRTFMHELLGFPNSTYKDQVDALSLAAATVQKMEEQQLRIKRSDRPMQAQVVMSA